MIRRPGGGVPNGLDFRVLQAGDRGPLVLCLQCGPSGFEIEAGRLLPTHERMDRVSLGSSWTDTQGPEAGSCNSSVPFIGHVPIK